MVLLRTPCAVAAAPIAAAPIGDAKPAPVTTVTPAAEPVVHPAMSDSLRLRRYPPRHFGKGAKIGVITGGIAGLGLGTLAVLYANAEDDGEGFGVAEGILVTAFVGAFGGVSGGLFGAYVGSLIRKSGPGAADEPGHIRPIGSVALSAGGVAFTDNEAADPGILVRASVYSHFWPWLAAGAETGFQTGFPNNWRLGIGVRVDPFDNDPMRSRLVHPYVAGSLGGNFWAGGESLISGDAGVGIEHPWNQGLNALGVEARYHWNLQNAVYPPGQYDYASLALTWRNDW